MKKRALITGLTGQDGSYLAELLLKKGYSVFGLERRSSSKNRTNIAGIVTKVNLISGDLLDQASLVNALTKIRPQEVYNLAAQSFVAESWAQPIYTGEVTALGALRLLEAIRQINPKIKFYQASSSEMFGKVTETPQNENTPFYPRSPYGVAKLYAHWITVNYRESYGMYTVSGILFNHESPRRGLEFVTRKIVNTAVGIKFGLQKELRLGNINTKRDWGFAGDYVKAMWMMMQQARPKDYVIATGKTHTVKEFLEKTFDRLNLNWKQHVIIDKSLFRPVEVNLLRGNSSRARRELGWRPAVDFDQLVKMMVEEEIKLLQKK